MDDTPRNGLDEFKEVLSDFRSVSSWTIGGAIAVPLADLVLNLGPPWPPGVPLLTSSVELIMLIWTFNYGFKATYKRLNKNIKVCVGVLCVSFICYLALFSSFTFAPPGFQQRDVKGFAVRRDVRPLITDRYTEDDALKDSAYNPSRVYYGWSIMTMRISLLVLWLAFFTGVSGFIGNFILAQRRRKVRGPQKGLSPV